MTTILDILRGAFAFLLVIAAIGLIMYFVVPGMMEGPAGRDRTAVAIFGGVGLIIGIALVTFAIAIGSIHR